MQKYIAVSCCKKHTHCREYRDYNFFHAPSDKEAWEFFKKEGMHGDALNCLTTESLAAQKISIWKVVGPDLSKHATYVQKRKDEDALETQRKQRTKDEAELKRLAKKLNKKVVDNTLFGPPSERLVLAPDEVENFED
jgi:hypothetical protein